MNEINIAESWIYTTLSGNATIAGTVGDRIFVDVAPQDAAFPLIVFALQSSFDVQGNGTHRTKTRPLYSIRFVTRGDPTPAVRSAADALDDLIGRAVHVLHAGAYISGRREQLYRISNTDSGIKYVQLGGLYRLEIYDAP